MKSILVESSGLVPDKHLGHLKVKTDNDMLFYENGFDSNYNFKRGMTVVVLDSDFDKIHDYSTFDTHADPNASNELMNYCKAINPNQVCVFICIDECSFQLSSICCEYFFDEYGLNFKKIGFRYSYASIAKKQNKTVFVEKNGIDKISVSYTFTNDINPFSHIPGITHGDSLKWNSKINKFDITQIKYEDHDDKNKPNFIVLLSGQSNSQGWNSFYDEKNWQDQPHDRIFGWNETNNQWEKADMNTESLGQFLYRYPGWQSLAFHFCRRLVEGYDNIRPGIINVGIGGQSVSRWCKFSSGEKWFDFNMIRSNSAQGDIFDMHVSQINHAITALNNKKSTVDVVCWHQGESDGYHIEPEYYIDALNRVIKQYRSLEYCTESTPFIVGETTGAAPGTNIEWEARNIELNNLNIDGDPYTKCVKCADLETSNGQYKNGDFIHFSANAQRKMGTRYFRAFRSIFDEY